MNFVKAVHAHEDELQGSPGVKHRAQVVTASSTAGLIQQAKAQRAFDAARYEIQCLKTTYIHYIWTPCINRVIYV